MFGHLLHDEQICFNSSIKATTDGLALQRAVAVALARFGEAVDEITEEGNKWITNGRKENQVTERTY
jgi:hypothetical protein